MAVVRPKGVKSDTVCFKVTQLAGSRVTKLGKANFGYPQLAREQRIRGLPPQKRWVKPPILRLWMSR